MPRCGDHPDILPGAPGTKALGGWIWVKVHPRPEGKKTLVDIQGLSVSVIGDGDSIHGWNTESSCCKEGSRTQCR